MPIVVGMGLMMTLIGVTMIVRAQGDQVTASAQKGTAHSLSLSETSVTRTLSFFKQYPGLAARHYDSTTGTDEWTTLFTTGPATACSGSSILPPLLGVTGANGWVVLSNFGHFKIIKYIPNTPSPGVGTLEVLGTTDKNTATLKSTNKPEGAITSLSVQIPYVPPTFAPPAIWATTFAPVSGYGNNSTGQTNQQFNGNVLVQDCNTSNFDPASNFPSGNPNNWTVSAAPYIPFPTLPALPPHVAARATVTTLGSGNITLPDSVAGVGPDPGTTDTYSYLVPSLIGIDSLIITPGKNVRLYVQGNIDLGGNSGIATRTNALQIYGSNAAGTNSPAVNYRLNSDTTGSYTTTEIGLSGNANIYAFIFAPAAIAGVKGGGNSGGFYGSIWVRNWASAPFGSSSNHIVVNFPSTFDWSLLPSSLLSGGGLPGQKLQPLVNWQRKETL